MQKKIKWEKWIDVLDLENENEEKKNFILHTPMGLITHKIREDHNGALNFWVGHTNFDIDEPAYHKIKDVPGVEISTLFTAYSFRICIGKMFNEKLVMRNIGAVLGCFNKIQISAAHKSEIIKIKKEISSKKYWCIYILPNGSFEYVGTNDIKEFNEPTLFYRNMKELIGGIILSSENKVGV